MQRNRRLNIEDGFVFRRMRRDPLYFVKVMWKLDPQPLKKEYKELVERYIKYGAFEKIRPWHFQKFKKGKHITWQQYVIMSAIGYFGRKKMFSVRSGRGIGKTCVMSWLVLWYLFCHQDAQVSCSANTSQQIYDVLWKEVAKWINKMPDNIQKKFEWQASYIRIHDYPNSERVWWARARTASKENPEAISGMHGDHQGIFVDESSGVADEIFEFMEGALTDTAPLVFLISNPTRVTGYFHNTHKNPGKTWYTLAFNAEESPVVSQKFIDRMKEKYNRDDDEYKIHVLGEFPSEDAVDDKGYARLLLRNDFRVAEKDDMVGEKWLGIDPAGEGSNKTAWVVRDSLKARVVAYESVSSPRGIAHKTLLLMDHYEIPAERVVVDSFGVGANAVQEIALIGHKVHSVNVGSPAKEKDRFLNLKAELYFALKEWLRSGGEIVGSFKDWEKEFLSIKYGRGTSESKIKIMPKKEMLKEGFPSPDRMDALMLTFYKDKKVALGKVVFDRQSYIPEASKISYKRKLCL